MRVRLGSVLVPGILVLLFAGASRPAAARPQYAAREGMYCGSCHLDPAGGGMRNGNGFSYARGRHAWEVESKFEEWKVDPEITRGVRLGADLRYAGMAFSPEEHYDVENPADTPWTFASFAMQGAAYIALSPVENLFLYYNHDLGTHDQKRRDWWGMLRNLTDLNLYIKAGQIRTPYGVRLDDHTAFVRGQLVPLPGEIGIMDLNPRHTSPGVELGLVKDRVFVHAAWQDPGSVEHPNFTELGEKMVSGKAGIQAGHFQLGGSFRANGLADGIDSTSSTRYGLFALFGQKSFALVAEADAGEDEFEFNARDVRAAYLAGEFYVSRGVTLRGELNYMDVEDQAGFAPSLVSRRYGAGLEWNPIPFLRLAGEGRYVSNSTGDRNPGTLDEMWGLGYAVVSF